MRVHLLGNAAHLAHHIVGRHIVDVVAAVKIVEALIGGQILAVVAEIPFADKCGVVACGLQNLGKGNFVAKYAVHVAQELEGIEISRRAEWIH